MHELRAAYTPAPQVEQARSVRLQLAELGGEQPLHSAAEVEQFVARLRTRLLNELAAQGTIIVEEIR